MTDKKQKEIKLLTLPLYIDECEFLRAEYVIPDCKLSLDPRYRLDAERRFSTALTSEEHKKNKNIE